MSFQSPLRRAAMPRRLSIFRRSSSYDDDLDSEIIYKKNTVFPVRTMKVCKGGGGYSSKYS